MDSFSITLLVLILGLLIYVVYEMICAFCNGFTNKNSYTNDDERLYNPLTGKYYEIDFSGKDVIYEETTNQENSTLQEKTSQQKKFHEFRKYIEATSFEPVIGEEETDEVFVWIQDFDLVNSIIEISRDILYFKYKDITLVLFTGNEFLDIGIYIIFTSKTFTGKGIMTSKPELHQKIEQLFPSLSQEEISPYLDKYYEIIYDKEGQLIRNLTPKAITLLENSDSLNIEFKDGHTIMFQEKEADKQQLNSLLALANELK